MSDFVDDEAEESEEEEEEEEEVDHRTKKKAKKARAMEDSSEEEEADDEDRIREELNDLIDDNPIEDSEGEDSDGPGNSKKRKKSGSSNYDDQLEDDDYELLEENLGITVNRTKRFKRLRRVQDPESDEENEQQSRIERDVIANQLFDVGSGDEIERMSVRSQRHEDEIFDEAGSESHYSDADDFIVDNDGRPITEKRRNKRPVFSDATLQEAQDIFGIDFDYEEFDKYGDQEASQEEDEDEENEYIDDGERPQKRRKAPKDKAKKRTIFDLYEPSELKRGHFTDRDSEIRSTDIPERMQQRSVPIKPVPEGSDELEQEAEWIYRQAFCRPTISIQDAHMSDEAKERARKGPQTVPKIRKALDFMRNQNFEVPFISFYRKEYVQPELNINDLWKVYRFDAKWCELRERKASLVTLFEHMRDYQLDEIMKNPEAPLPESTRVIREEDIDRLKNCETSEELNDIHHHFMLYYSHEVPNMQAIIREKNRYVRREDRIQKRQQRIYEAIERGEEPPNEDDEADAEDDDDGGEFLKQAVRTGSYAICRKAGLHGLAKKFGLPPEQFAENVRDNYQRHEVDQEPNEPSIAALEYCSPQFNTARDVLEAAGQMVAIQLAREPLVRKCVREAYMERAKISVMPTKCGTKEIDESHPIYAMKYLKDKPVSELVGDQYLRLAIAERDKLVTLTISEKIEGTTSDDYVEEIKQLYHRDEFSKTVQDWNALRARSVEMALGRMIIPDMQKELRANLMAESKEYVLRACCRKMYNWIKVAPYAYHAEEPSAVTIATVTETTEENWDNDWDAEPTTPAAQTQPAPEVPKEKNDELDAGKGLRVMGIAYVPDFTQAAFACLVAPNGECTDHLRLPNLLRRKNSFKEEDKTLKEADLLAIRAFISGKKPHVIALGGESREAMMIAEDLRECITILNTDERYPQIQVEIVENELAKIYAQSIRAVEDYRDFPVLLRQAISLARRLQDPLVEFSQLCTPDDEILCLNYHAYQDQLPKDELLENLQLEFVNRVNEVGVDINRALQDGHSGNLLQFVCGLGPRKAQLLVKTLRQTNQRIENRTQLVTSCHMGPKVFINCAGFVKIDTNSLGDSTEVYVEVLDGSRVHPETYEWARKMAVDALEYDDDEDANPAGALEDIFKCPERLKDLDLDAFAEELERQGFGNKSVTLYDIRAELNCRYKDLRAPYESPSPEKLFDMLTKETPESFYIGKLIQATVTGFVHKKPEGEQLDQANPLRNDETSLWQCPFCMKNDFPELSEVWGHFDAGECVGRPMGVRLRLDNGISGFIHVKNLSDKRVENPEQRVRLGQVIHCRVIKIEVDRFSVECTSKSSDLADKNNEMRPQRDTFYDTEAEERAMREEEEAKRVKQQRAYMKRVIVHPAFQNITYAEAAKLMTTMKQGDVIIRPSSKGADHLTVTWKVAVDVLHHIDVREEGKKFGFSLGEKLWIGTEEYEDLDEIIARHVNPMAAYAAELLECNYYKPNIDGVEAKAEEILKERKREKPSSIPCILSPSKAYPGKFLLSYLPRERCQHEFVTVTPDGVRYRSQVFPTIGKMFSWFKKHFREPRGVVTPKTPAAFTPGFNRTVNDEFTPHHTLSLTADETPHQYSIGTPSIASAGGFGGTPYTPSGKTPFMTPGQTPGNQSQSTPGYSEFRRPNAPPIGGNYRSNSSFGGDDSNRGRGRGRGRGQGRGRGCRGSGSFAQSNFFNSFNDNSGGNFNSSCGKNIGGATPLWDESESWDSPPEKTNQKATNSSISSAPCVPRVGGVQTPLWDESESWDSPGEATLPNDPRAARAASNSGSVTPSAPIIGTQAPLWDPSESWDSPTSDSRPNDNSRNNSASGSLAVPIFGAQAPVWEPSESWDSPTQTPAKNNPGSSNVSVTSDKLTWNTRGSWDSAPRKNSGDKPGFTRAPTTYGNRSMGSSITQPTRRDSYGDYNQSSFGGRGNRGNRGNRGSRGGRGGRGGNDSWNSSRQDYSRNSSASVADSSIVSGAGSNASLWDESESWDSPDPITPRANRTNGDWNSSNGPQSTAPILAPQAPLWDESESWDTPDPDTPRANKTNKDANSSNAPPSIAPIIAPQAPLWDESESWDTPDPVTPQANRANNNYNPQRQTNTRIAPNIVAPPPSVPAIVAQAPLWDESESWDTPDPVAPQANRANNNYNPQRQTNTRIAPNIVAPPPSVPAIVAQAPLWDESESWDTPDPVAPQANRANNNYNLQRQTNRRVAPNIVAPPPSVPAIVAQAPLWDESENWDTPDSVAQVPSIAPNNWSSQEKSAAAPSEPISNVPPSTIPPIIVPQISLFDESESWDNPEPSTSQQPTATNRSSFGNSCDETSSNCSNSSNVRGSNRGWNSRGDSYGAGNSTRNSTQFQRPRGNQQNNSGRWNDNQNWNSRGSGNSRDSGRRGGGFAGNSGDSGRRGGFAGNSGDSGRRGGFAGNSGDSGRRGGFAGNSGDSGRRGGFAGNSREPGRRGGFSGNSRGRGGRGGYQDRQSRDNSLNSSVTSSASGRGGNAPLWDANDSWDTAETSTSRNENPAARNTTTEVATSDSAPLFAPIAVNIAPLYNESESWD